jgi:hypothetical protein
MTSSASDAAPLYILMFTSTGRRASILLGLASWAKKEQKMDDAVTHIGALLVHSCGRVGCCATSKLPTA